MPVQFEYGAAELIFAAFMIAASMYCVVLTFATTVAYLLTREHAAEPAVVAQLTNAREVRSTMQPAIAG